MSLIDDIKKHEGFSPTLYRCTAGYDTIGDAVKPTIAAASLVGTNAARDVIVQLYDASSYNTVYAQVVRTDANTVTIDTNGAIASNDVIVLITKVD